MQTLQIQIKNNNYEVLKQIENFISTLKDVKLFKSKDDFSIDEKHCIKTLRKIENKELYNFKSVEPQELFKKLGF